MSYLSGFLSSIGGAGQAPPAPAPAPSKHPPASRPLSQGSNSLDVNGAGGATPAKPKRKAEGELNDNQAKVPRRDQPPTTKPSDSTTRPQASSPPSRAEVTSPAAPLPYRGTARPTVPSLTTPKPAQNATSVGSATSALAKTTLSTTSTSTATPKRGYQAILERAKAAQGAQATVGAIKHKPLEKLTKKGRLAQQAEASKGKLGSGKDRKPGQNDARRSAEPASGKAGEVQKEKRKPLDLGYKGTARPSTSEPAYKGTANLARPSQPRKPGYDSDRSRNADRSRSTSANPRPEKEKKARYAGYASYSEDDLDDYTDFAESDDSDMEADAFEMEEEEAQALRAAKKEDEEALREENELKRKKAERKRMLAKMATEAAKKKRL